MPFINERPRPQCLIVEEVSPGATPLAGHPRGWSRRLEGMKPGLPGVVEIDTTIFRPATFVEDSIDNLSWAAIAELPAGRRQSYSIFLYEWRTAIVCNRRHFRCPLLRRWTRPVHVRRYGQHKMTPGGAS